MNRRTFLAAAAAVAVGTPAGGRAGTTTKPASAPASAPAAVANKLPRWRGFNLLNLFNAERARPFDEADFALLAEWGFDFVRLPASYLCWSSAADQKAVREAGLAPVDQAVKFGQAHGIHVNLNLHRLPGFCVNPPKEPNDLWRDAAAVDAAVSQWAMLAERYKAVPSAVLSFDPVNEPGKVDPAVYVRVMGRLVDAIRAADPKRLVLADGLMSGTVPVPALGPATVTGQSYHGYDPMPLTHYKAGWIHGSERWPEPTWPLVVKPGDVWDKARLKRDRVDPWVRFQTRVAVGVHVGEWGVHNRTPHAVALAWMADCLDLWRAAGWGWSLWNLYGSFGVLDNGRTDGVQEPFRGHQLDRKMLELLRGDR